jgi:putative CocE/NonD family hydrolase
MRYAAAVAFALLCGGAGAQPPDPKACSPRKHAVRESRGHKAAMRDGVKLSVDFYRPEGKGRYPAILIHTPDNNNSPGLTERAKGFARRGYFVALSDCRGRFDSEGDWDPFGAKHKSDGYDLVEWLAKQPGCDGKVGMMGQSYMGWTQWWTATQAPPSLKAIVPEVAPPDQFYNGPYQNGILVCWMMDWPPRPGGPRRSLAGRTVLANPDHWGRRKPEAVAIGRAEH